MYDNITLLAAHKLGVTASLNDPAQTGIQHTATATRTSTTYKLAGNLATAATAVARWLMPSGSVCLTWLVPIERAAHLGRHSPGSAQQSVALINPVAKHSAYLTPHDWSLGML
jgi:hypothetical protein